LYETHSTTCNDRNDRGTDAILLPAYVHEADKMNVELYDQAKDIKADDDMVLELHKFYLRFDRRYNDLWQRYVQQ
jgi:hypothetical protein